MRKVELIAQTPGQERIDRYLSETEHIATRAQVQKLLRGGLVLVDGKQAKPSHRLKGGERLQVTIPEPEPSTLEPAAIPLDIVYEDEFLVVVNKAPGMVVHPGGGVREGTLVNALLAHCKDLSGIGGVLRPGIVHRLDKGTSGLIIAAKDDLTHLGLSEALKARKVKRTYEAIVWGHPAKKEAIIDTLIGRSRGDRKRMAVLKRSGRQAVTSYRVVEEFKFASSLIVNLRTGRTHQIRVHLAHIGHPVFGDATYGGRRRKYGTLKRPVMDQARCLLRLIDRQALHARELAFVHPRTGSRMKLAAPMPHDIKVLLHALRQDESEGGRK